MNTRGRGAAVMVAVGFLVASCGSAGEPGDAAPEASVAQPIDPASGDPAVVDTESAPAATSVDAAPTAPTTTSATPTPTPSTTEPAITTSAAPPSVVERSGADVGPSTEVGEPLGIRIPSLDVDSPIVPTGLEADGTVAVPPSADVAGWFDRGPRPGDRGPSVVMAHVDSARTGPGVFYRLRDIQVGAIVTIDTADGPVDFVTQRIEQHPKIEFPTDDVYGPVPGRELRLVTCGGEFDRSVRSYFDNIIVYLVRSTP